MELVVDLHIHSHFSRATSKAMNIASLYRWGKIKGIQVIGTGDFTHPDWLAELKEKLEPAEPGLFCLKKEFAEKEDQVLPQELAQKDIRFILSAEISNIYSKNGKVRKLHNLVIVPSFAVASAINTQLEKIGNLKADGRPILGMDSKELLKITLQIDPDNLFIPAHIWTPWFSMFGSKSGFDSIEEAFEELTPEIKAIETGLSSDPFMNWRLSGLDEITIVSNSDAHSPGKLGREANVLNCELSYQDIIQAIKTNDQRMLGTIEFFPQEGKYHYDGHRACQVCCKPSQTKKYQGLCPKCGQPLVLGVDYRVQELADRPEDYQPKKHKKVEYIIPLVEILGEIKNIKSPNSKAIQLEYERLYSLFGDEFSILRKIPLAEIQAAGFSQLAQALKNMRQGQIHVQPGYDGVYGIIKVFADKDERQQVDGQLGLGI